MNTPASDTQREIDGLIDSGLQYQQRGDHQAAAAWYERALQLAPANYDALQLLGLVRLQTGSVESGITLLQHSLAIEPRQLATLNNLGGALRSVGQINEAIGAFRSALQIEPTHVRVLINLGSALLDSGDTREAAGCFAKALDRDNKNPEIYCCVGHLYRRLGRPIEAAQQFRHALHLSPGLGAARRALGLVLDEAGDAVGALEALRTFEAATPTLSARIYRAYAALRLADWRDWASDSAAVATAELPPGEAPDPGRMMSLPAAPGLLREAAVQFVRDAVPNASTTSRQPTSAPANGRRLRVAYLSPDFHDHAVGHIISEVFERRDGARFEVFGYGWGAPKEDPWRTRIEQACDHFEDVSELSDRDVTGRLRDAGIDIVVDLAGHTGRSRPLIFASRPAPVQVCWLGYPGTTGASYMDYLVADDFIIPPGFEHYYTESVVRLPDTYLPYDRTRQVAAPRSREEYGLPPEGLVLASFCQTRKINPPVFDRWMEALRHHPRAVLWLASGHPQAITNLRREAEARGVSGDRLVFALPVPSDADHLARYRVADLALDTFPYGSHSTAADALWVGCPLVAVTGESFVSRVSGSVLRAAGFPELVASSLGEYHELIRALMEHPARIGDLRQRITETRARCALFDVPRFVKALEDAYLEMWSKVSY